MEGTLDAPAPAQTEAPAPLTPVHEAVVADDLPAFKEARLAERIERSAPKAPTKPEIIPVAIAAAAPAKPEEPVKAVSKRQQEINERIREAVQRGIEEDRARRASAPPPSSEAFPAYAEWAEKHPDQTFEQYVDARQDFREEQKARVQAQSVRQRDDITQKQTELATAQARVQDALADPAFEARFKAIPPALLELPTRQLLEATQRQLADQRDPRAMQVVIGPENDFASEIVKSEYFPQLAVLAAEDPSVMAQVRACQTPRAVTKLVAKLETRFESGSASTAASAAIPKTLTSAPDLGTTLGSRSASPADPIAAAVKSDDLRAFKEARMAKRLAKTRR